MLKKDSQRANFLMLRDVLEKLREKRTEKENKLADNSLSFPELRDKLLSRVKSVKSRHNCRPNPGARARCEGEQTRRGQHPQNGRAAEESTGWEELIDGGAEAEGRNNPSTRFSTPRNARSRTS